MNGRELSAHERHLVRRLLTAQDEIFAWSEIRIKSRDQLLAGLGADDGLVHGMRMLSVTRVRPNRFNVSRFKRDHPAMYAAYCEPGEEVATLHTHAARDILGPNYVDDPALTEPMS